jgi:hypothetical protein
VASVFFSSLLVIALLVLFAIVWKLEGRPAKSRSAFETAQAL